MLNPDFPVIEGKYQLSKSWSVVLPSKFNLRIEDEDIVIWRPKFTIYIAVWNNDKHLSHVDLFDNVTGDISSEAFSKSIKELEDVKFFSYRLAEDSVDVRVAAFYCYAVSVGGYVQAAMYFDNENDAEIASRVWESFKFENAS